MNAVVEQLFPAATRRTPVVIVGAGPVGIRIVQELHRRDAEQPIVIYGDEPWEPYNRVRLSSFLASELAWEDMTRGLQLPAGAAAIQQVYGRIVEIDREQRRVRDQFGHWQNYSSLVLTTGSRPYVPDIPGGHLSGVYTFRDMSDTQKLFARQMRSRQVVVLADLALQTQRRSLAAARTGWRQRMAGCGHRVQLHGSHPRRAW